MTPTIGRIVHYVDIVSGDIQAAIITAIPFPAGHEDVDNVDLQVFYRNGMVALYSVSYSENLNKGHWSWPARV